MKTPRRFGPENSATRTLLLDATERLMLEEGYAAVTTRRVAKEVGLTPELAELFVLPRHALHAARITVPHPDGGTVTAEAPLPADMAALL